MNGAIKDFLDFLMYIGIVSNKTSNNFNKNLSSIMQNSTNEKKQNKKSNIYQILSKTLNNYFTSLSSNDIKLISENITNKYKDNKFKIIKNLMRNMILNKEQKNKLNYLEKWVDNCNKLKNEELKLTIQKQEEENINNNLTIKSPHNQKNENEKNLTPFEKGQRDLIHRQKQHLEKFQKNKMEQIEKIEQLNNQLCPFSPTIYTKNSKNAKSFMHTSERNPYKRLYEDVAKRQSKILQTEKEENEKIKRNSVWKSSNKLFLQGKSNIEDTINKLYNDHKKYENKKRIMRNNIDKESGLTFQPDVSTNSKYSTSNKGERVKCYSGKKVINLRKELKKTE